MDEVDTTARRTPAFPLDSAWHGHPDGARMDAQARDTRGSRAKVLSEDPTVPSSWQDLASRLKEAQGVLQGSCLLHLVDSLPSKNCCSPPFLHGRKTSTVEVEEELVEVASMNKTFVADIRNFVLRAYRMVVA